MTTRTGNGCAVVQAAHRAPAKLSHDPLSSSGLRCRFARRTLRARAPGSTGLRAVRVRSGRPACAARMPHERGAPLRPAPARCCAPLGHAICFLLSLRKVVPVKLSRLTWMVRGHVYRVEIGKCGSLMSHPPHLCEAHAGGPCRHPRHRRFLGNAELSTTKIYAQVSSPCSRTSTPDNTLGRAGTARRAGRGRHRRNRNTWAGARIVLAGSIFRRHTQGSMKAATLQDNDLAAQKPAPGAFGSGPAPRARSAAAQLTATHLESDTFTRETDPRCGVAPTIRRNVSWRVYSRRRSTTPLYCRCRCQLHGRSLDWKLHG